jgi:hypothetical protein
MLKRAPRGRGEQLAVLLGLASSQRRTSWYNAGSQVLGGLNNSRGASKY